MLKPHYLSLLLLAVSGTVCAIPPGHWENRVDYEMVGVPIAFEPYTVSHCIDAAHPAPKIDQPGQVCRESELSESGESMQWQVDCSNEFEQVRGSGSGTFTADSSSGEVRMEVTNASGDTTSMVYRFSGKRTGPCE